MLKASFASPLLSLERQRRQGAREGGSSPYLLTVQSTQTATMTDRNRPEERERAPPVLQLHASSFLPLGSPGAEKKREEGERTNEPSRKEAVGKSRKGRGEKSNLPSSYVHCFLQLVLILCASIYLETFCHEHVPVVCPPASQLSISSTPAGGRGQKVSVVSLFSPGGVEGGGDSAKNGALIQKVRVDSNLVPQVDEHFCGGVEKFS